MSEDGVESFDPRRLRSLFYPDPVVERRSPEFLHQPTRPANRAGTGPLRFSQTEKDLLAMLGEKSRSGLQHTRLAARFGLHRDRRADGVAIALVPAQTESDGRSQVLHHVLQKPQLRAVAILQRILPAGRHDRNRRARMPCHPQENPDRRRRKHRRKFRRGCWRKTHSARNRSRCHRSESVR